VVGKKNQDFILLWVIDLNSPEGIGAFLLGERGEELNEFIYANIPMLGDLPFSHDYILGIVFHASYEIDSLRGPFSKQAVIVIPPLIDNDSPRIKFESLSDFDTGESPFDDEAKVGGYSSRSRLRCNLMALLVRHR
jgi:hypothetical protein